MLLPRPHTSEIPQISPIQCKRTKFPVHSPSFQVSNSTVRIFQYCQRSKTSSHVKRSKNTSVLGRLGSQVKKRAIGIEDIQKLIQLLRSLGWIINLEKSELKPTQNLDFLGYKFSLKDAMVFPTQEKVNSLKNKIDSILKVKEISERVPMSLIGSMASVKKSVPLGRMHMRPFQWHLRCLWRYTEH